MIEVTIKLNELHPNTGVLRSYASVGRAFDAIKRALDLLDATKLTQDERDTVDMAYETIECLKLPLNELQALVREELMKAGVARLWTYDGRAA